MANETTQTSVFDSTPDSQMYEYKQTVEKVQKELLKYGLTSNQSKVFIYLGKYGSKTAPQVCKALKLPRTETYHLLSALQNKGIVSASRAPPPASVAKVVQSVSVPESSLATVESVLK